MLELILFSLSARLADRLLLFPSAAGL